MKLAEIQRCFAAAVMAPNGSASRVVKRNVRMTARDRVEVYRRSYWERVLDSMREDFPGLERMLGREVFDQMAVAYLRACPSRSFTLRDLGSRLPDWLAKNRRYAGSDHRSALDMARLEWAHIQAFDGPDYPALEVEEIAASGGDLRIALQGHVRLVDLDHSADVFRVKRRNKNPRAERCWIAVHRSEGSVYYKRLAKEQFVLLGEIRRSGQLGDAVDIALAEGASPTIVGEWFSEWARMGWFTRAQDKSA